MYRFLTAYLQHMGKKVSRLDYNKPRQKNWSLIHVFILFTLWKICQISSKISETIIFIQHLICYSPCFDCSENIIIIIQFSTTTTMTMTMGNYEHISRDDDDQCHWHANVFTYKLLWTLFWRIFQEFRWNCCFGCLHNASIISTF